MRRRVTLVDRSGLLAGDGKFVLITGHHCNFEWMLLRLSLELGPGLIGIYKPLRGWGEQYFLKVRGRFGAQLLPSKAIREEMARVREARVLGLVADQVPRTSPDRLWTRFLHQDTAFFKGPERMARLLRAPIVYGSMRRLGPGQYEVEFEPLTAAGERLPGGTATERYARILERDINIDPAGWWWSHRRWKLTPPAAADGTTGETDNTGVTARD
jgi:KDO2-lipid IV(A) lauroyltransferase